MYSLSPEDFSILADPQTTALVESHLADDPAQLALRLKGDRRQVQLVCQQVKYLQRIKNKLPTYHASRCLLPPLACEQCSSEAAAAAKTRSGGRCIDLTCGRGVDSYYFSRTFAEVIAVEREPVLAQTARHNFELLGVRNITVENAPAEEFLARYTGPPADLIYVDPARRSGGERVFRLEECSPDVLEMMPLLLEKGKRVLLKLSPLFDIGEALRLFAGHAAELEIVSAGGEVKELLVELTAGPVEPVIVVRTSDGQRFRFTPADISAGAGPVADTVGASFLLIPDAAFYKGRLVGALLAGYDRDGAMGLSGPNGFVFADRVPEGFPGRVYRILDTEVYRPKNLKKTLKEQGRSHINVLRRNFPQRTEEITRALGVREGGNAWFAFTQIGGRATVLRVEPVAVTVSSAF
jgi:precorrin-6B methylase 2